MLTAELICQRVKQVRRCFKDQGIDALLLTFPANVRYCTGFRSGDSWALIMPRSVIFMTDSRYTEQAAQECLGCRLLERQTTLADLVAGVCEKTPAIKTLGVESSVTWQVFQGIKKVVKPKLKAVTGCVEQVRTIKDEFELACIKKAIKAAKKALSIAWPQLKPGMTEVEFTALLEFEMQRQGTPKAFETIVGFGANGSRPHHQPGSRKLRKRDSVLIDYGASYEGYCSDMTRTLAYGKPTPLFERAFDVVARAQAAAIAEVRDGASLQRVDQAARDVIAASEFPVYGHGSGHGFGLIIHEDPFLKPEATDTLETGQVLTMEPGIYLPGKLGIRLEDDLLVTESGCRLLTRKKSQAHSFTELV